MSSGPLLFVGAIVACRLYIFLRFHLLPIVVSVAAHMPCSIVVMVRRKDRVYMFEFVIIVVIVVTRYKDTKIQTSGASTASH